MTEINLENYQLQVKKRCSYLIDNINQLNSYKLSGYIVSAKGTLIIAKLKQVKIGDLCKICDPKLNFELLAEVFAIEGDTVKLIPFGNIDSISRDCSIYKLSDGFKIQVGDYLIGKIINGFGDIIGTIGDNLDDFVQDDFDSEDTEEIQTDELTDTSQERPKEPKLLGNFVAVNGSTPDPLKRPLIDEVMYTGVKAIDLFNTCGKGQRVGIFAGPGVGKTTLMGMITRNSQVDIVVVCLIGERGREVREFIELELMDEELKSKCVLVVTTSDRPPVEQIKCAYAAQTICEYFRTQGKNVLLFMDSITRFARAVREVGLSVGEPITRGGYPPSVFLSFPKLMERAGLDENGSITAFYTVLMEAEAINDDPIADEVKSIIDGHIVLSQKLAEQGHFPAINILSSLSRVADRIIPQKQLLAARHLRLLLSKHEELEFLLKVGEYKRGKDKLSDESIDKNGFIMDLLKQNRNDYCDFNRELQTMLNLANKGV